MSNYTKVTNFTAKDSLPSGNAGKVIKGVDFDTEFNAIATAIATKADSANAALTGTPTAPTASAGTNTTQIATTAFVAAAVGAAGSGALQTSGGTMTGLLDTLTVTEKRIALSSAAIDLSLGQVYTYTVSGAQTFTFTNTPSTANTSTGFILVLTNGGSATVTWPSSVKWPSGTAPTLTTAGIDVLVFVTTDAGTTWRGALAIKDSK